MPQLPRPPHLFEVDLGPALRQAGTPRGQLLGLALIVVPALTNALPLSGTRHTLLQLLAVVIGTLGMIVVFGGMLQRAVLARPNTPPGAPVEAALLAVPHAQAAWRALVLLSAVLLAGGLWCLVLVFGQDAGTHLSDALILTLPGLVLSWAAWRARAMRLAASSSTSAQG